MHNLEDSEKSKMQRIIAADVKDWETLSHSELIDILIDKRWYELEDIIAWGDMEVIDEMLEEIENA